MAFPTVASITETTFSVDATSHLVNMPASVGLGGLLLVFFTNDGDATVTTPAGWEIGASASGSTFVRGGIYYKVSNGLEASATVDFVTSASEKAAAQVYYITPGTWGGSSSGATDISINTAATSGGGTPDPDSVTAAWGSADNLFITYLAASSSQSVTSAPTNYSSLTETNEGAGTTTASVTTARRALAATSDDPGAFTVSGTFAFACWTVVIRPSVPRPIPIATGASFSATDGTTLNVSLPTMAAGDLMVVLVATDGTATTSVAESGWTNISAGSGTNPRLSVFAFVSASGRSAGNLAVTASASEAFAAHYYHYAAGTFYDSATETDIVECLAESGTSAAPNQAAISPAWGAQHYGFITGLTLSAASTIDSLPGDYLDSGAGETNGGGGTAQASLRSAWRVRETISTENPGAWALSASTAWRGQVIAIRPYVTSVPASLTLSTAASTATATLAVQSPALLTLSTAASVATAATALYSPALLSLAADGVSTAAIEVVSPALLSILSDGLSTASVGLSSPALLALSAADGLSTAAATVMAPSLVVLSTSDGVSTASATVITLAAGEMSLDTTAGEGSASLVVSTTGYIVPGVSAAVAAAAATLSAPTLLSLSAISGLSSAAATVISPALLGILADGTSTAAATVSTIAYLVPATIDGVATAALVVISPALLTMQADGVATASAVVFAPANVIISATAGVSTAALAVKSPALLQLSADGLSATAIVVKSPALLSLTASGLASATALVRSPALMVIVADGTSLATISELSLGPSTKVRLGGAILLRPVLIQGGRQNVVRLGGGYSNPVRIPGGF